MLDGWRSLGILLMLTNLWLLRSLPDLTAQVSNHGIAHFGDWSLMSDPPLFLRMSGRYGPVRAYIASRDSHPGHNFRFDVSCNPDHLWINIEIGDGIFAAQDQASVRADLNGFVFDPAAYTDGSGRDVEASIENDMIKAPVRRDFLDMLAFSDAVHLTIIFPAMTRAYDLRTLGTRDAIAALDRTCGYVHDI